MSKWAQSNGILRDEKGVAHILGLSGGKDSTALAILMSERHPEIPMSYLCTPTGDELPEMIGHWENLEGIIGRPIVRLTNTHPDGGPVTLDTLIRDFGALPNFRQRWCTRMLKIQPTRAYMKKAHPAKLYVGLRADEPTREGIFGDGVCSVFPLREWGMGEADVWKVLEDHKITVPRRTDCARCYHQRLIEWKFLLELHPDIYEDACRQEDATGHTLRTPGRDTWPVDLRGLGAEFLSGRKVQGEKAYRDRVDRGQSPCRVCSL